jgi:hypothetical protein
MSVIGMLRQLTARTVVDVIFAERVTPSCLPQKPPVATNDCFLFCQLWLRISMFGFLAGELVLAKGSKGKSVP